MPVFARVPRVAETAFEAVRWIGRQRTQAALTLLLKLNRLTVMTADAFLAEARARLGGGVRLELLPGPETSVAASWNAFLAWAAARGDDRLLVINHDAFLEADTVEALLAHGARAGAGAAERDGDLLWTAVNIGANPMPPPHEVSESPDFSCYMLDPRRFATLFGRFDENFSPAYFEDNDAHARIALAGRRAVRVNLARFFHRGSDVIKEDGAAAAACHGPFGRNQAYFARKWGRAPVNQPAEMRRLYYPRPFNDAALGLNDWHPPAETFLL
jgi:hypothetical protein